MIASSSLACPRCRTGKNYSRYKVIRINTELFGRFFANRALCDEARGFVGDFAAGARQLLQRSSGKLDGQTHDEVQAKKTNERISSPKDVHCNWVYNSVRGRDRIAFATWQC
jgi:rubredoxin